jgi:hypothetical protein
VRLAAIAPTFTVPAFNPFGFPITPARFPPIRAVCVALSLPPAVRSLPPRAVAPCPPTEVIRPALSRVRRLVPRGADLAFGRAEPPPPEAKRPLLSLRYVLAMAAAASSPQVS